ncbi:MAG: hypothetical protein JNK54_10550 [Elusimicrobia bacterium]|nr:hypothetical protein [Elusimicrobiota bacterium]
MGLSGQERSVGREALVLLNGLRISVVIRDVRLRPMAVDYLIEPVAGDGRVWADGQFVDLVERPGKDGVHSG